MAYNGNRTPASVPTPSSSPRRMQSNDYEIVMEKNKDGRKFPVFTMILVVFVCFFMLSAVIYSNVQQLQINNEITEKQKELTDLQSENVRMQSEIAGKTSNKNVQEYAMWWRSLRQRRTSSSRSRTGLTALWNTCAADAHIDSTARA